jgi:hypothetical protein
LWNNANSYDANDIVYVLDPIQTEFFQAVSTVPQGISIFNTSFWTPYSISSLPRRGAVYVYVKSDSNAYMPISPLAPLDGVLSLDVVDVSVGPYNGQIAARNYGTSVDFGNQTWAAAGAPGSLGSTGAVDNGYAVVIYKDPQLGAGGSIPYGQWQLLTSPNSTTAAEEFGYSVAMSLDERWLYVGAPGANAVYAYGRVDWEKQSIQVQGDGVTTGYFIGDIIQIDANTQLTVSVAGDEQILGTNYTVTNSLTVVEFTTAPADTDAVEIIRTSRKILDNQTTYAVVPSATSGSGTGAEFTVSYIRNKVGQPAANAGFVEVSSGGQNYSIGNTITLAAASFGGNPANGNITLTVSSVNGSGAVLAFSIAYTPSVLTTTFSLNEYLFTADNINSFTVLVNDVLQRPNIDYTFSMVTGDLTFATASNPAAGANIFVRAEGYFLYSGTISNPASASGDRFGRSVSTSTDGRQILIGADKTTVNTKAEAGTVYVYDRDVQRFIVSTESSTANFTVLGSVYAPVSVLVNGTFLINELDAAPDATNTFSVNGNTITVLVNLQVGDIVEIETNDLQLVQTINQDTVAEFSNYGYSTDLCSYNCSLYVGAPNSGVQTFKGGAVERQINQSRAYGIITGLNANPNLDNGDTIRINNQDVVVPDAWTSASTYAANTVVYNTNTNISTIYSSLQSVPAGTALSNTSYWKTIATTAVVASAEIRALAAQININVPNVNATVDANGYLTLAVKNSAAAAVGNKLQVAPGSVGTTFEDIGFDTFVFTQTIVSPYPVDFAGFGTSVSIDDSAINLVVGAPRGTLYLITIFDQDTTVWDEGATDFFDQIIQSGAVYTYDLLSSSNSSVSNPDKFVFGQQIDNPDVSSYDQYGTAVDYTSGVLFTGAPGNEFGDSTMTSNYGRVFVSVNTNQVPAWTALRTQQPVVDIRLLNSVYSYDRLTSATGEYFDFFDPLQGKILGAARQNLDYIGAVDPASYNVGPVGIRGTTWGQNYVGQTWWDTSTVRFIDPNQDDIVYASRRWGQTFPGSAVDVYQWIVSSQSPANYTGEGIPLNTTSYVIQTVLSPEGIFNTEYYFWVRGLTVTATQKGKTLPVSTVSNYIENPRASGISYLAPINSSTVAIYNAGDYIEASDTILSIEFDKELTDDNVHVEYELIAEDKASGWLSDNLYRKLQDSFCGVDTAGNLVPDVNLNVAERYGVQFRPRQSMFVDRYAALKNYLVRANTVLAQYPISENREFNLLNSSEPEPSATSGVWNKRVANLEILGFQNIYSVALGYVYLVVSDSRNRGLWTLYEVIQSGAIRELQLIRVQNYDTRQYWSYINWYLPGYNTSSKIIANVPNKTALDTLTVPVGSSVQVTANSQGKFEIYIRTLTGWDRVGLQDGTIAFSAELWDYALGRFGFDVEVFDAQYFDQEPVIETRKIIQAINEELFIDDLLIERNRSLILMFDFVLSEFAAPEWLVKTSLIDVEHRIRALTEFQNYSRDNQEFVLDYIKEVKPYHVSIREFNLRYNGFDQWFGDMTDFDLPAYYNTSLQIPQFTSPILLPYDHGTASNSETNNLSDLASNSTVWANWPYSQWFNNYTLRLDSVDVIVSGSGYTEPPLVVITPNPNDPAPTDPAIAVAILNSLGQVVAVNVTYTGAGYKSTPSLTFDGGNGSGAIAYPRMTNDVVRQFRTVIRYDRFQYQTAVETWSPNGTYENGTLVRYDARVWSASNADGSSAVVGPTFDVENWTLVNAATYTYPGADRPTGLTGVDRTMGLYVPGVNEPGLELPLLVDGVDYPGVQVWGEYFAGPLSNLRLDADYQSRFADIYLGTRYSDINVDGGEFIGLYEGHAPEELVNGAEYDTLDMRIYTRPGSDWQNDGHGFQIGTIRYTFEPGITFTYSWAGVVEHPFELSVSNLTTGRVLARDIDYTIDWQNQTITIISGLVNAYDIINIDVYEIGGGSQLYRNNYLGQDVIADNNTIIIPVNYKEIVAVYVFVNGTLVAIPELSAYTPTIAWDQDNKYQSLDVVYNNNQITVTDTSGVYNILTCNDTSALTVGQPIVFSGSVFGGIVAGQEYYVYSIANSTQFFICDVAGATSELTLTSASGSMIGSPKGIYYRAVQTVPAGIALTNTAYWLPFNPALETQVTITASLNNSDGISLLVLGDANSISVTQTQATGNAIVLLGSTGSLSVGQTVTFSGYSLGGVLTGTIYTIFSIVNSNSITISEDGVTEVALIDDQAAWVNNLVAKFVPTDFNSWSTSVTETFVADSTLISNGYVTLSSAPIGTNPANMIVNINGVRLTGPACIEWIGDGTTNSFGLPQRLGSSFLQSSIDGVNDIQVWVDNVLQQQTFGAEAGTYYVTNWSGSNVPGRQVVFNTNPPSGAQILIAVSTVAQCQFSYDPSAPTFGADLQISTTINLGDVITVTTWNDTAQQNALTLSFVGPVQTGVTIYQAYDETDFDSPSVNNPLEPLPGQFAYEIGTSVPTNDFDLLRDNVVASRLWVTLDGLRLFEGSDYTIQGQYLILSSGAIDATQTLMVTEFTNSVVPEATAFRIFQDMRGVQATYRITTATTTMLAQNLSATADVVYVDNANALTEPDLPNGVFGVITIDGERIMYRYRDTVANTVSGLQRGTAGTAAAAHATGVDVYDLSRGNLLNETYQDYIVKDTGMGDGTTTVFYAPSIDIADFGDSSTIYVESIEVYVGGIRQYNYSDTNATSQYRYIVSLFDPLAIEFITDNDPVSPLVAPAAGSEVTILQRRGLSWYEPGVNTASNGVALQETDTQAARFLCDR